MKSPCCTEVKRPSGTWMPASTHKEGNVLFNDAHNTFYLVSDIW